VGQSGALGHDTLRQETLALFPESIEIAMSVRATEAERRLRAAEQRLADGKLMVVVCGEFKRGKSSLLNALLGAPGLFPVDDLPATSVVATVVYGAEERIEVGLLGADGELESRVIERVDLQDYVTEQGNPGNDKAVRAVAIEIDNDHLRSGLMLVDTPGVGGVHTAHTIETDLYLPAAHAIVFVTDAGAPMTQSESDFLRRAAAKAKAVDDEDALLFVMTKIDVESDYETLLADTRKKIAKATDWPVEKVTVMPVSSQEKLRFLASGSQVALRNSRFPELERRIWAALTRRRASVLLGTALQDLESSARSLLQPIEEEIDSLWQRTDATVARGEDGPDTVMRWMDHAAEGARLRNDLVRRMAVISQEVRDQVLAGIDEVWNRTQKVDQWNDEDLRDAGQPLMRLKNDMAAIVGEGKQQLDNRAAELQRDVAASSGLALGSPSIRGLSTPPVWEVEHTQLRQGDSARLVAPLRHWRIFARSIAMGVGRGGAPGAAVGRIAGLAIPVPGANMLIGTAVGGALGAMAGGAWGVLQAVRAVQRQDAKVRREQVLEILRAFYRANRANIRAAFVDEEGMYIEAIMAELDSRMKQDRQRYERAVQRRKASSHRDQAAARARLVELAAERAPLDRILGRVAELAGLVLALTTEREPPEIGPSDQSA